MKPRACVVVASEMTVRVFLARQLAAMEEHYDLTVVVNSRNERLLDELGVRGALKRLPLARTVAPLQDVLAFVLLIRVMAGGRFALVHSMTPKAGLLGMIAARLAGVPVRIHTFTGQVWATHSGVTRAGLRLLDRLTAACATLTLADSPSQRAFLIEEGVVPAGRLSVLGRGSVNGVDATLFRRDACCRQGVRQQLGIPSDALVLLFMGRLTKDKGVLDLACAFAMLAGERPEVRLLVVGPDEEGLRAVMTRTCAGHSDRVHFVGFTRTPEAMIAASDVLCLPSYREGFGNVVIEAAAGGIPAVASRIYGLVDAVDEGCTGLLHEPGDVLGLLAHLRYLAADSAVRRSLGEAARLRAVRDFSQRSLTSELLGVYAQALDTSGPEVRLTPAVRGRGLTGGAVTGSEGVGR